MIPHTRITLLIMGTTITLGKLITGQIMITDYHVLVVHTMKGTFVPLFCSRNRVIGPPICLQMETQRK